MAEDWLVARIFISSTFRDMHPERDHLVRFIFPELKELCRKIQLRLIDVDLRWGVTEKDAQDGKALDICLDEIDSCRPFFIGMLGERYGYVPPGQKASITAQEIYHGVLHGHLPAQILNFKNILESKTLGIELVEDEKECLVRCYRWDGNKQKYLLHNPTEKDQKILRTVFGRFSIYQKDRSFFFFRSDALTRIFAGNKLQDFYEFSEENRQKLQDLKRQIQDSGLPVYEYNDLESFGKRVLEQVWAKIQIDRTPTAAKSDWVEQEREMHNLFVADRTRRFVGRSDLLNRLHLFASSEEEPPVLILTGESGSGKSSTMARFAMEASKLHPDWLIFMHFVGASPTSSNIQSMLRRLCAEIGRAIGDMEEPPTAVNDLAAAFEKKLKKASAGKKVLLMIDGANQFEQSGSPESLQWIPQTLSSNSRIVFSTLPGPTYDILLRRTPKPGVELVEGLSEEEIHRFVRDYLSEIRRQFPNLQIEKSFFRKVKPGNPLYILTALEELRVFGDFEQLPARIEQLPQSLPQLFNQVLIRIENDFHPELVRDCLSLIACGRHGMSAQELQEILSNHSPSSTEKLPDMIWARLKRAMGSYLFDRSGILDFFHSQMKESVIHRYFPAETDRENIHKRIADYFEARWAEPSLRALDELPFQLGRAAEWKRLTKILTNLRFIEAKFTVERGYDLISDYGREGEMPEASLQEMKDFADFAANQAHILNSRPVLTLQQAANQPDASPVSRDALTLLTETPRSWLRWHNKTQDENPCIMTLTGHTGSVICCSYSPDAERIVSGSNDKTCRIWDSRSGAQIVTFAGHTDAVLKCKFTPDGRKVISVSQDKTIRCWDAATASEYLRIETKQPVEAFAVSPSGNQVAVACSSPILQIFDVHTGNQIGNLSDYKVFDKEQVEDCVFLPDGNRLVASCQNGMLRIWNLQTGKIEVTHQDQAANFGLCRLLPDGKTILHYRAKWCSFWSESPAVAPVQISIDQSSFKDIQISPDGEKMIAAWGDGRLQILRTLDLKAVMDLIGHRERVVSCDYSSDGTHAISGGVDSTLKIWSTKARRLTSQESIDFWSLAPNGEFVVFTRAGKVRHERLPQMDNVLEIDRRNKTIEGVRHSPDGNAVGVVVDRRIEILDSNSLNTICAIGPSKRAEYTGEGDVVEYLFTPDSGALLVAAKGSGMYEAWKVSLRDIRSDRLLQSFDWKSSSGQWCFTPGGSQFVAITDSIEIWSVVTGKPIRQIPGGKTRGIAMSPDGRFFCSIAQYPQSTATVWNLRDGSEIATLRGHAKYIKSCAFSRDGKTIGTFSTDWTVRLWNAGTGEQLKRFDGNSEPAAIHFLDDNRHVMCGFHDGSIKVWRMDSGQEIFCFFIRGYATKLATAQGGRLIVVGNQYVSVEKLGQIFVLSANHFTPEPPVVTAVRLFHPATGDFSSAYSTICGWCRSEFIPLQEIIECIVSIAKTYALETVTALDLPDPVWCEPELAAECPHCFGPVRFNPFLVDESIC